MTWSIEPGQVFLKSFTMVLRVRLSISEKATTLSEDSILQNFFMFCEYTLAVVDLMSKSKDTQLMLQIDD